MKQFITEHEEGCHHRDGSRVLWDPESAISACADCGALTEQREVEDDPQQMGDLGGHPT